MTSRSVGRIHGIDGDYLGQVYKDHLSGYEHWDQKAHAKEWILTAKNMGRHLSIDESMYCGRLYTFVSNKDAHGGRGTIIAIIAGVKAATVLRWLLEIPEEERRGVLDVSMDFSDSMKLIAQTAFPNARISLDRFHVFQDLNRYFMKAFSDVRDKVQGVGWVKDAKVVRMLPDTVMISVEERPALAVWQNQGRMKVIDGEGRVISEADPARFPQLPLVVGQGADQAAGLILPAVASRPRLRDRLEALVRVDDRRWDLRLKDGSLIQLPAIDEESALIQLDQLDQRQRILDMGFARIDLRDPEMVAVRPRDAGLPGQPAAGGA